MNHWWSSFSATRPDSRRAVLPLDIDDRIGGSIQTLGTPGFPVVLTSANDCSVGAGFNPEGMPQSATVRACGTTNRGPNVIDIVLALDDTASFSASGASLIAEFPQIVATLETALPDANFAFSIARFEEYASDPPSSNEAARPFILNQPVIETSRPQFQAAIDSALARVNPPGGGGAGEPYVEALYQIATGAGFDHNGDGDVSDSGPAGLVSTQINPTPPGDVPDFASFMEDPTGPVIAPDGSFGGVGFRTDSNQRIVLLGTDGFLQIEDDGQSTYSGVNGVTVDAAEFDTLIPGTPGDAGQPFRTPWISLSQAISRWSVWEERPSSNPRCRR